MLLLLQVYLSIKIFILQQTFSKKKQKIVSLEIRSLEDKWRKVGQRLILHFINRSVLFYSHKDYIFSRKNITARCQNKGFTSPPNTYPNRLLLPSFYILLRVSVSYCSIKNRIFRLYSCGSKQSFSNHHLSLVETRTQNCQDL